MGKILWTPAEKKVLDLAEQPEKFKDFLQYCRDNWYYGYFLTTSGTTGWHVDVRKRYWHANPRRGDDILVLGRALSIKVVHESQWGMISPEKVDFLEKLWVKWGKLIRKGVRVNYTRDETPIMKELLARGFVHHKDLKLEKGDYFIHGDYFLVYQRPFSSRVTAKKAFKRFAIKPLCTIKRYKPLQ